MTITASRRWFLKAIGASTMAALSSAPLAGVSDLITVSPPKALTLPPGLLHVFRNGDWRVAGGILSMREELVMDAIDVTSLGNYREYLSSSMRQASMTVDLMVNRFSQLDFIGGKDHFAVSLSGTVFKFEALSSGELTTTRYDSRASIELSIMDKVTLEVV